MDPESIDLAALAGDLEARVPSGARAGELVGRTVFRDATVQALGCSQLEAEQLVDTLVLRGFLVFEGPAPGVWSIRGGAAGRPLR